MLNNSYYLEGCKISLHPNENLVVPGRGSVLVTNQKSIHPERKKISAGLATVESELTYRILVALPESPVKDSLNIGNSSLCKLVGRYELPDSLNLYYCREGYLKIDSVKSSSFHAFLRGKYFNIKNDSLQFSGELRVKKEK